MSCKSLKRYKTGWKNEAAINHGIIRGLEPTHCRENPDLNRILMLIKITLFAKKNQKKAAYIRGLMQ